MSRFPSIEEVVATSPVIPVVTISDPSKAVPMAQALVRGGVNIVEITLRTGGAFGAINAITSEVPEIIVGAGTVRNAHQLEAAMEAGAKFGVSPGSSPQLRQEVQKAGIPFLFGGVTPTEVMTLLDEGYTHLKFFPAEAVGGIPVLKALSAPIASAIFCPTGGIDIVLAKAYLELKNVVCVGGSWVADTHSIECGDWSRIEANARQVMTLRVPEGHGLHE